MADLREIASRLFEGVMAPLVLGGPVQPGHAIGARAALALGSAGDAVDAGLLDRVQTARVRRARRLAPVDALPAATKAEWAMLAALHDMLQAANPTFDAALRRGAAGRILELAIETLQRVPAPPHVGDALSRHTWLARLPDLRRTDTEVSWWTGSRTFRGVPPPARLQAWPDLRRVTVVATPRALLELSPLAVDRDRLEEAVARLLLLSPVTDLATAARKAPAFAWSGSTLALVARRPGRTLALRALDRLAATDADAALGRATRALLAGRRASARPALDLLAERAVAAALGGEPAGAPARLTPDAQLARGLGAAQAMRLLETWPEAERDRLTAALAPAASTAAAREATAMLEAGA